MLFIHLPFKGSTKIPGAELGFKYFLKENYMQRNYYYDVKDFVNLENYENDGIIEQANIIINKYIENKDSIIIFGGTHSTTDFFFRRLKGVRNFPIIVFDAHIDKGLWLNEYYNWNVLSRINDLIPKGLLLGVRHYYKDITNPHNFEVWDDIAMLSRQFIADKILNFCESEPILYVSIDLDVINPVEFPGVGFPEPGGINLVDLIYFIRLIRKTGKQIIWDIVEFNPLIEKDKSIKIIERVLTEILHGEEM